MGRSDRLMREFSRAWGGMPDLVVRAPGRVNLIGEHTDYNEGFVLPIAIDREIRVAARRRADDRVRLYAADFREGDEFALGAISRAQDRAAWSNYARGVADTLRRNGYRLRGMDCAIDGDIPQGAGLSSSAALETAFITAFRLLFDLDIDPLAGARLAQRAENDFVGVRCGIMDQMASFLGRPDSALLIDCRSLSCQPVALPAGVQVVVVNSGIARGLVDSAYNDRRAQCDEGACRMGLPALRDASPATLDVHRGSLSEVVFRRCRHVVSENQRVLGAADALRRGDVHSFGRHMNASHASLRDDFAVTTPEIDTLVAIQQGIPGCFGARMTGAGFGGCTVALVAADRVDRLVAAVESEYSRATGKTPTILLCRAAAGAGLAED